MFTNTSELLTLIKQDMGLSEVPKPLSDQDLLWRLQHSTLKEFSTVAPYTAKFLIGETNRVCRPVQGIPTNHMNSYSQVYQIPKHMYQEHTILGIPDVNIQKPNGYNDLYVPQGMIGDPTSIMMGLASIEIVGAMARTMTHALTWDFRAPDILILYNGWSGGTYEVELAMDHDPSLSTLDPSSFMTFRELATYDIEAYCYEKLKRIQNFDTGIGSIELKIDDWADAKQKKADLLRDLAETCALDYEHIRYW